MSRQVTWFEKARINAHEKPDCKVTAFLDLGILIKFASENHGRVDQPSRFSRFIHEDFPGIRFADFYALFEISMFQARGHTVEWITTALYPFAHIQKFLEIFGINIDRASYHGPENIRLTSSHNKLEYMNNLPADPNRMFFDTEHNLLGTSGNPFQSLNPRILSGDVFTPQARNKMTTHWYNLGVQFRPKELTPTSLESSKICVKNSLRLDPNNPHANFALGRILIKEAHSSYAYVNKIPGWFLARKEELKVAKQYFEQAKRYSTEASLVEQARLELLKIEMIFKEMDKNKPSCWIQLGDRLKTCDFEDAKLAYQTALKFIQASRSNNSVVRDEDKLLSANTNYRLGLLHKDSGRFREAEVFFDLTKDCFAIQATLQQFEINTAKKKSAQSVNDCDVKALSEWCSEIDLLKELFPDLTDDDCRLLRILEDCEKSAVDGINALIKECRDDSSRSNFYGYLLYKAIQKKDFKETEKLLSLKPNAFVFLDDDEQAIVVKQKIWTLVEKLALSNLCSKSSDCASEQEKLFEIDAILQLFEIQTYKKKTTQSANDCDIKEYSSEIDLFEAFFPDLTDDNCRLLRILEDYEKRTVNGINALIKKCRDDSSRSNFYGYLLYKAIQKKDVKEIEKLLSLKASAAAFLGDNQKSIVKQKIWTLVEKLVLSNLHSEFNKHYVLALAEASYTKRTDKKQSELLELLNMIRSNQVKWRDGESEEERLSAFLKLTEQYSDELTQFAIQRIDEQANRYPKDNTLLHNAYCALKLIVSITDIRDFEKLNREIEKWRKATPNGSKTIEDLLREADESPADLSPEPTSARTNSAFIQGLSESVYQRNMEIHGIKLLRIVKPNISESEAKQMPASLKLTEQNPDELTQLAIQKIDEQANKYPKSNTLLHHAYYALKLIVSGTDLGDFEALNRAFETWLTAIPTGSTRNIKDILDSSVGLFRAPRPHNVLNFIQDLSKSVYQRNMEIHGIKLLRIIKPNISESDLKLTEQNPDELTQFAIQQIDEQANRYPKSNTLLHHAYYALKLIVSTTKVGDCEKLKRAIETWLKAKPTGSTKTIEDILRDADDSPAGLFRAPNARKNLFFIRDLPTKVYQRDMENHGIPTKRTDFTAFRGGLTRYV